MLVAQYQLHSHYFQVPAMYLFRATGASGHGVRAVLFKR